jgi:hypothetical protein
LFDNAMQLVEIGMINENRPAPGSPKCVRHRWLEHHQRDTANVWRRRVLRGASTSPSTRSMEWDQRHWMSRLLHRVGDVVANPSTGILAATALTIWGLVGLLAGFPG